MNDAGDIYEGRWGKGCLLYTSRCVSETDVTEIIMNIKELAIRNNSADDEPKVAYIEFSGEGVVTAADIQVDQDIQIMNPDLVIAHLNGGADSKDVYKRQVQANAFSAIAKEKIEALGGKAEVI